MEEEVSRERGGFLDEKRTLYKENQDANVKRSISLKNLDSSIKRNTSFIKKLKQLSEDQKETLCQELQVLNLTRYISEVVTAISEAKLKPSDINAAVKICSLLHQRYADFTTSLIPTLQRLFAPTKPNANDTDLEKGNRFLRKRSTLRLLGELYLYGVFNDADILLRIVQDLVASDQMKDVKENRENGYQNLVLIVSFLRTVGEELLGLKPRKADVESISFGIGEASSTVTKDQRKAFINLLNSYYDNCCQHLVNEHKELRRKERENHHILETKGELSEANSQAYDRLRKSYEKLLGNITQFGDLLDKDVPTLPEDTNTTRIQVSPPAITQTKETNQLVDSIFDDEDTRSFYENLPDLRALVPGVLFGDRETEKDKEKEKDEKEKEKEEESADLDKTAEKEDKEEEGDKLDTAGGISLEGLLNRLPNCVNRDLVDQAAIDFCYVNSKNNRKKLVKSLFNVSRTQLVLLPYYSRMIAILNQCMKDLGPMLVAMLDEEFQYLYQKKDQTNIESKIKNIRFMAELTKFRICPSNQILNCLKLCLDDFMHHNIDVACNLLETCGRFLFRTPETHIRTKNLLEMMMRLKNVQNLANRLDNMVENAYYHCIPPERQSKQDHKHLPPLHQYIQYLIFHHLNKNTTKYVLKQLRKIPWSNAEDSAFVLKCLLAIQKGKYNNIHLVASLASGLATYHELLGIQLVDTLLEWIQEGLEDLNFKLQQRQIMYIKLLGELYNYCLVESQVVFDALYTLIEFGHDIEANINGNLDGGNEFFRCRLICTLLDTCGQYFDRGSSKKRLDRFLVYFQRYILSKVDIPMDVEFMLSDCFESLRPHVVRFQTWEQANEAVQKLIEDEKGQPILHQSSLQTQHLLENSDSESEGSQDSQQRDEEEEEEEGDKDDNDEDDEESSEIEEEEEKVEFRSPLQRITTQEDEEFDKELSKLVHESLETRKFEMRSSSARMDMSIPMTLLRSSSVSQRTRFEEEVSGIVQAPPQGAMQFQLLMKKGNKQTIRNLNIPLGSPLAVNTKSKKNAEREEQQELKRLVLEYEEREVEDQVPTEQALVDSSQRGVPTMRGRGGRSTRGKKIFHSGGQHRSQRY